MNVTALSRVAVCCSALALSASGELPTEFRLFVKGWNQTENGDYLFDEAAAAEVMAAYKAWGVDLMIDLEHQSLEVGIPPEPTAKDARGWCQLELRADGSLWAVNVTWTPDGAQRLRDKRQRYVSPAFGLDPESRRITNILNVAITAIPATHDTPALVAAKKNRTARLAASGGPMDPKLVKDAIGALKDGDAKKALDILEQLLVSAAGGDPDANTEDAPPPVGDGGADEGTEGAAAAAAPPPPPAAGDDPTKKKDESMLAAARLACAITGKTDPGEAMAELERRSKLAVDVEASQAQLAADTAKLEATERRALVGELVKLGNEIPATAWADDKGAVPCERLAKEPIAQLRDRVAKLRAARGHAPKNHQIAPPPAGAGGAEGLTERELALCKKHNLDPAKYAATRADIRARSTSSNVQGA